MTRVNIPFIELKCWKLKVPVGLGRGGEDSQVIKDNKALAKRSQSASKALETDYVIGASININIKAHLASKKKLLIKMFTLVMY